MEENKSCKRKAYRPHVWLSEREYMSVQKHTEDEWGCELALNILEQYKVARGKENEKSHDYLSMKSWVFDLVEIKRRKRRSSAPLDVPPHEEGEKLMRVRVTDTQRHTHELIVTELKYWQLKETNAVTSVEIIEDSHKP